MQAKKTTRVVFFAVARVLFCGPPIELTTTRFGSILQGVKSGMLARRLTGGGQLNKGPVHSDSTAQKERCRWRDAALSFSALGSQ